MPGGWLGCLGTAVVILSIEFEALMHHMRIISWMRHSLKNYLVPSSSLTLLAGKSPKFEIGDTYSFMVVSSIVILVFRGVSD